MEKTIIGVDNGLDGALCALRDGKIIHKRTMPVIGKSKRQYDVSAILEFFNEFNEDEFVSVIIEKAQAMPKQGVSSTFKTGYGFGLIEGIVASMGYTYVIVTARAWQKEMFAGLSKGDTKKNSIVVAQRFFPKEDFRATERCRIKHHGLTDATLLAIYGGAFMGINKEIYETKKKNKE